MREKEKGKDAVGSRNETRTLYWRTGDEKENESCDSHARTARDALSSVVFLYHMYKCKYTTYRMLITDHTAK